MIDTVGQPRATPERDGSPFQSPVRVPARKREGAARHRRGTRRTPQRLRCAVGVLRAGLFFALICEAAILTIGWVQAQAAVDVVEAQAEAIREGQFEKAYGLFSASYRAGMSLPSFRRWLGRRDNLARNHGVNIWGRSVHGSDAILWGSLRDELGHNYSVRYELVREKGNWRVDSLQLQSAAPDSIPEGGRLQYI